MLLSLQIIMFCLFIGVEILGSTEIAFSANIEAVVSEKPTIRSEIMRGLQSIEPCLKDSLIPQPKVYADCITEVVSTAARNATSTSPFQLGIHFEVFVNMWRAYSVHRETDSAYPYESAVFSTSSQFTRYEELLKEVGITTDDLCLITKENCSFIKELMDSWKKTQAEILPKLRNKAMRKP
jgi:hypothetical protein